MFFILLLLTVASLGYYLLKRNYKYWENKGVPGPKPKWFVGNVGECFLMKKNPGEVFVDIYRSYPNTPVVGAFRSASPILVIRDPELIKEITIKAFSNFHDNDINVNRKDDPLFGRNIFCLKGEEWKTIRSQLTPAFTSGKMKWLFPHLIDNGEKLVKFINSKLETFNGEGFEVKDLCVRFTLNNVASCAFGLDGKCFEDENSDFKQLAKNFMSAGSWSAIAFFLMTLVPSLSHTLSVRLFTKSLETKLSDIIAQTVRYRKENVIYRNDFLNLVTEMQSENFEDIDVIAQAAGFFVDGYETSSTVMMMIIFELAKNSEAQIKLKKEIDKKFEENDNKLTYDVLNDTPFLDAVFCETMRLYPILYTLFKICTNTYTFTPDNCRQLRKPLTVEKGIPIAIPIYGLHTDPKYFEEPKKFKPERFLATNKEKILKCTYMPFGEGPRACLGRKFGTLQVKCGVAHIIKNFSVSLNQKTTLPIKFDPLNVVVTPISGIWIDFKKNK